jgi:hypothetical protein
MKRALLACAALTLLASGFAQTINQSPGANGTISIGSGDVQTTDCPDGTVYTKVVPNLICAPDAIVDPFDCTMKTGFRPEVINLDGLTIRQVLEATGTQIECEGFELLVQAVRVVKETPVWKCTAFVTGPGSGLNTNFDTGWKYADSTMLDESLIMVAFGQLLGNRALLFSPPATTYYLCVWYVRRELSSGRVGPPIVVCYIVTVKIPSRADICCNVEYFSTVAAGVTQKPKIHEDVAAALCICLLEPEDLVALLCFETVVALTSIDFSVLRDMKDAAGVYDARFARGYMIDSDEEPIGCLLIEMANAALWH